MQKVSGRIPYCYITVKTTKSRIGYGFLTIPVSLTGIFPKKAGNIYLVNEVGKVEKKHFNPYYSTRTRECRIYGLREFFRKYQIKGGDEIVIQVLDDDKYKIVPEKIFEKQVLDIETKLMKSSSEEESESYIHKLAQVTNNTTDGVIKSEFIRLANEEIKERKIKIKPEGKRRENVPASLRKILLELYRGKCQISNFSFLMKNGVPYFEIHHIDYAKGNHFKNLLVVSPNVHAQFTYTNVEEIFDKEGWLRKVKFNKDEYPVKQIIDSLSKGFEKEIHFFTEA